MSLWTRLKALFAPSTATSVAAGMQVLTPGMAALMPPRELARRWTDFLPLLGPKKRPVFLALGGGDATRKRLWLSTPECKYLRDEPSALAFVAYPDSLWLDVPAAFVSPPASEEGAPAAAAGAPGLWEELVRFLPQLPGDVQGVAIFVDAARDPESAARDCLWIAGKLDRLYSERGKIAPAIWIVSTGVEKFPGGARLAEKTSPCPEPLGASGVSFDACLAELEKNLGDCIRSCDATGQNDTLSPEIHLLRHSLPAITRNAKTLRDAIAHGGKAKAAPLGGVFLCGEAARGLAFAAALPRSIIPEQSRRMAREKQKPSRTLHAATTLLLLAGLAGLGVTHSLARTFIDALPFSPPDQPSVARYARAHAELVRLEHSRSLTRALYAAPNRALAAAEKQLAVALADWLPAPDNPARADALLGELAEWAEGQKNITPIVFSTLSGKQTARVRGAHSRTGRNAAADLLAAWRTRLDSPARAKIDFLQQEYDARLQADWRRNGRELLAATLAVAEQDDFARTKDFLASDPAAAFVHKAGEELAFAAGTDRAAVSEWSRAAIAAAAVMKDASPDSDAPAAKRLRDYREILAALHPRSLDETALSELAADTYSPPGGNPPPPSLSDAEAAWLALETALRTQEPSFAGVEGGEVSALLQSRQTLLRRSAVRQAAARVQTGWIELVRMPLERLTADAAVLFLLDEKPHRAFTQSFTKRFLVARNGEWRPARALEQDFPFTEEAIGWLNRVETVTAGLDEEYPVRLTLLPVTVDRGATLFPRAIRFTQTATTGTVSATGYNNRVEAAFTWSARTCSDTELSIQFDTLALRKIYPGRLGFLRFLQSLRKGTIALSSSDFPESRRALERGGIRSLHAHFELSDPKNAAALNAEISLPPPANATEMLAAPSHPSTGKHSAE